MAKLSYSNVVAGLLLMATAYLFYHTFDEAYQTSILTAGRGPVFFPRIVLGAMLLFSLITLVEGQIKSRSGDDRDGGPGLAPRVLLPAVVVTGGYILSISWAGFVIPTVIFTFLLPLVLGYRNWLLAAAISISYTISVWYIFERVFLIILPSSPWFGAI
jgi:putative tricarboxylic transport membrane protein